MCPAALCLLRVLVNTLFGLSLRVISTVLFASALTGCGAISETSRSATVLQVPQPAALTALSFKFRSETPHVIHFGFDFIALDEDARRNLDLQAEWILAHPSVRIRVYGHADKVGSKKYNADLGLQRATNAVAYLVSKGVDPRRLEAIVSYGEDAPIIDTDSREHANRRVVTEVISFIIPIRREDSDEGQDPAVASVTIADSFTDPTQIGSPLQGLETKPEQNAKSEDNSGNGNDEL